MEALKLEELQIEKIKLQVPSLDAMTQALSEGLAGEYEKVVVDIVKCPDLTLPPFNLAAKGLGGNPSAVQVGDPSNFVPVTLKHKIYDFKDVSKALGMESSFIIGAGGGCWPTTGNFSEMYANVLVDGGNIRNYTKEVYSVDKTLEGISVRSANVEEGRFSVLGSLFVCRGDPAEVIRISCKRRIAGDGDLPNSINLTLKKAFDQPIALGIIMLMTAGKAKHHVAPGFSEGLSNTKNIIEWLLLPSVAAPFISVGITLTSNPPCWNVQEKHFHSFSQNGGGHYHSDVTPEEAEYAVYVMPAETLCSIDKAKKAINLFAYES